MNAIEARKKSLQFDNSKSVSNTLVKILEEIDKAADIGKYSIKIRSNDSIETELAVRHKLEDLKYCVKMEHSGVHSFYAVYWDEKSCLEDEPNPFTTILLVVIILIQIFGAVFLYLK